MSTLRALSHGEIAFYNGLVSIPVMSHVEGVFPLDSAQNYLNKWIENHAIIGYKVTERNSKLYFEDQGKLHHNIEEIYCRNIASAEALFENIVNSLINPDSLIEVYLIRITNTQTSYLVTNISHIISDGVCNIALHRYLLESIDRDLDATKQVPHLKTEDAGTSNAASGNTPYPIEEYLVPRFDGLRTEDIVDQDISFLDRLEHKTLVDRNPSNGQTLLAPTLKAMKVMSFEFDETNTGQLVSWCKTNRVSVNDALVASLLKNTSQLIGGDDNHILLRQAVNLRKKVVPNIENDVFITSASSIISTFLVNRKDSVKGLCQQVSQITQKEKEFAPTLQNHIANKEVFRAKQLPLALHISNLGRLDLKTDYSNFKLRRFIVCPSANFGSTIPLLISTLGKRLTITCHANMNFFSERLIESLITRTMAGFNLNVKVVNLSTA